MKPRVLRRNLLIEAAVSLLLARLAIRFVPAKRLLERASRPLPNVNRFASAELIQSVCRAVEDVATQHWMHAKCLPQALAAQAMLRRRGVESRLCLGAKRESNGLAAHAWIELADQVVIGGGAEQPHFTQIVTFGEPLAA